eukprot:10849646-Prorocentrum_lima.AAC.1
MNGFEYTSAQVSVSDGMIPHRDANNLGPSWSISMGDVQGGLLWVESKEGRTRPPYTALGLGPERK